MTSSLPHQFAYELPEVPVHRLTTTRQSLVVADVQESQIALGPRYCHGGYVLGWQVDDQPMTSAPSLQWQPMLGCGMPWVFERGLARDWVAEKATFLRIGVGRVTKRNDGWNQGGGTLTYALPWHTEISTTTLSQRVSDQISVAGKTFGYELLVETRLCEQNGERGHELGFDQTWSLHLQCPWSEPIVAFPHPFGRPGPAGSMASWLNQRTEIPPEGTFSTEYFTDQQQLTISVAGEAATSWSLTTSYGCDKLVLFANEHTVSPEPYLVRCPPNGAVMNWQVAYRHISPEV